MFEVQASVRLVAIPDTQEFPRPVFVAPFIAMQDIQALPRQLAGPVKRDTRLDPRHQKLVRPQLGDECPAIVVLRSRWQSAIVLREPEGNRRLPVAKVDLLTCRAFLFDSGLQL